MPWARPVINVILASFMTTCPNFCPWLKVLPYLRDGSQLRTCHVSRTIDTVAFLIPIAILASEPMSPRLYLFSAHVYFWKSVFLCSFVFWMTFVAGPDYTSCGPWGLFSYWVPGQGIWQLHKERSSGMMERARHKYQLQPGPRRYTYRLDRIYFVTDNRVTMWHRCVFCVVVVDEVSWQMASYKQGR